MKTIYQVINKAGNPASSEHNPDAIFLDKENAKDYIKDLLVNTCGFPESEFKIKQL